MGAGGTVTGRPPPHDPDAEQGVLGALLLASDTVTQVVDRLEPGDFYRPAHQIIYQVVLDLFGSGEQIDPIIVSGRLDRAGDLQRAGGAPYLHTLMESCPSPGHAAHYAQIVAEKSLIRRVIAAGQEVVRLGYDAGDTEPDKVLDLAQQELFSISQRRATAEYVPLAELVQPTMLELEDLHRNGGLATGVPTGFTDLDQLTNGLHGGQMIIVAARPGVGKSTLALDFMRSCSVAHGKPSVLFSLEMSKSEIVMRLLSAEAGVDLARMRSGRMTDRDWDLLTRRVPRVADAPLYIDDSATLTMMEIRSKARKLAQQQPLALVVVDYLQLMSSGKRVESRQQEVSEFSRQLKLLAKELDVPVVAISQLNRGPETRTDKRPQLSDLRESGSLEQDADMVMLLHRPDSQNREDPRAGEADIILAKHRGGPIDTIPVAHQLHYSRFADMARG
ncbi:replicative DNA helicase [Corynebacterium pygosceleis]|uniref:replicative DNA helicase n=1 Tax=Corynebacterium pygosceleis TaxID=2800406 RepID=UPI003CFF9D05